MRRSFPEKRPHFPPRHESPEMAAEREARVDELFAKIQHHKDSAVYHQLQAEHYQREASRHLDAAMRKQAEGPRQPPKRR